jgi:hypothetical protein
MTKLLSITRRGLLWMCFCFAIPTALAQTVFLDFNTVGQYTNNFNPWNDAGGVNGGNYAFAENTTIGLGGTGGVSLYQSTDTTASYKSGRWNFATNGATITVSALIYASGGNNADKIQLGIMNSATNGLNGNAGVAFESFRFVPASTTSWSAFEQYRSGNTLTTSATLGNVTVTSGHWYKFVVALTNTSGASGNLAASCALFDYGTNGLTPGTNLITFSTTASHAALDIATNTAVCPALRFSANAAVNAWDNFLVFQSNSAPAITLKLANIVVAVGGSATFNALADGPGTITYAWFTNNILAAGATNRTYTISPVGVGLTNVSVVAKNSNGSATNSAILNRVTPILLTGYNRDVVIESNASTPAL